MCHFIESIRLENGNIKLLDYHQNRVNKTILHFFGKKNLINLEKELEKETLPPVGVYKIRILYSQKVHSLEILPYNQLKFSKFQMIPVPNGFDYSFKYSNRTLFEELTKNIKPNTIALFTQNKGLTDGLFANLVFQKNGMLFTPDTPLLNGVQRQYLLKTKQIQEAKISEENINSFEKLGLINAMIPIENINFIEI
ncbi:MAG: aminotransferase class IV [Bacteroidales bacterium]|nr:aminotransferase class IV [Bacteroidales bacterium]